MALLDFVYLDEQLTDQFDDATDFLTLEAVSGATAFGSFWVGTPNTGQKIQADSDPGVDPIQISIVDAQAGTGVDELDMKLALSEAGLSGAVAGDPVDLPATINYGTPVEVFFQWTNNSATTESTEISFELVAVVESAI